MASSFQMSLVQNRCTCCKLHRPPFSEGNHPYETACSWKTDLLWNHSSDSDICTGHLEMLLKWRFCSTVWESVCTEPSPQSWDMDHNMKTEDLGILPFHLWSASPKWLTVQMPTLSRFIVFFSWTTFEFILIIGSEINRKLIIFTV